MKVTSFLPSVIASTIALGGIGSQRCTIFPEMLETQRDGGNVDVRSMLRLQQKLRTRAFPRAGSADKNGFQAGSKWIAEAGFSAEETGRMPGIIGIFEIPSSP